MIPPACPIRIQAIAPPTNDPARPSPIVARIPIGSGPGSASRASAPTISPSSARTRRNQSTMSDSLRSQAFEQPRSRRRVLLVVEDARVMELLEQTEVVRGVVRRRVACVNVRSSRLQRHPLRECAERLRADLVRVDAGALQAFAVLLDADAPLGEAVGVPPPHRPLLDETPVDH